MTDNRRQRWNAYVRLELESRDLSEPPTDEDIADELLSGMYLRMRRLTDPANHGWAVRSATARQDPFAAWRRPDDPPEVKPEILAARCLGIQPGDPGPRVPPDRCTECWEPRYRWSGDAWGLRHREPGLNECGHDCHDDEVWMAQ